MSDPELELRSHIQRLQNRVGELEAARDAAKRALVSAAEVAEKALARLCEVEPLIEAAWRFAREDIAQWELIHHATIIGRAEIERRNKLT